MLDIEAPKYQTFDMNTLYHQDTLIENHLLFAFDLLNYCTHTNHHPRLLPGTVLLIELRRTSMYLQY